ncbi:MAG: hypothetical protein ACRD0I_08085 [Acidimicrobiales bacterium]
MVSLSGEDEDELRRYRNRLSESGTTTMPLGQAPWGDIFGMCIDQFGTAWVINIAGPVSS